jgi:Tfp pilus assembly protein FimV
LRIESLAHWHETGPWGRRKEGTALIANSTAGTRLCPNCANSIDEGATNCSYCKTDLLSHFVPQWLKRDDGFSAPRPASANHKRFGIPTEFIWMAAILGVAVIAFFAGGYLQHNQLIQSSQDHLKELQAKDQMVQSQEKQLAQSRQQLNENSTQLAEVKNKLEESQKELSATQQRLNAASREISHLNASRSLASARAPSPAQRAASSTPAPVAARRTAESGVYETTRTTSVYEGPSASSRVVSQINKGTRINVVGSSGEWLQVQSKHGNPPGYVRSDDARLIGRVTSQISRGAQG